MQLPLTNKALHKRKNEVIQACFYEWDLQIVVEEVLSDISRLRYSTVEATNLGIHPSVQWCDRWRRYRLRQSTGNVMFV